MDKHKISQHNDSLLKHHQSFRDDLFLGEDSVLISDRIKRERQRHHYQSKDLSTRDSIFGDVITGLAREYKNGQNKKRLHE